MPGGQMAVHNDLCIPGASVDAQHIALTQLLCGKGDALRVCASRPGVETSLSASGRVRSDISSNHEVMREIYDFGLLGNSHQT